ncbi:MAG: GNAT family N-acetyltransferase [Candidatus Thorarchaeota archaeon]
MKAPERLGTRRLLLRPYIDSDFKAFSLLMKDESISKYHYSMVNQQKSYVEKSVFSSIINSYNSNKPVFAWAICNKETDVLIGTCGLKSCKNNITECFYALLPEYRRRGYAIESMQKILEFSFETLKKSQVIINIHPNNTPGWKVAERIGMKYMGQFKHKKIIPKAMLFTIEKKEYEIKQLY